MEKLDTTLHRGKRLDVALAAHPKVLSRQRAKNLIIQNLIKTNHHKKLSPSFKISPEQEIFFELPLEKDFNLKAVAKPLEIHYEDEYLIVVYKPAGLVTHPAESYQSETLLHYLIAHTSLSSIGDDYRRGILHRIDKDTSGLLLFAKDDYTHLEIAKQFQKHSVHRKYLCFVCDNSYKTSGTIKKNICRHPKNRKIFTTHETAGRPAITHWKLFQKWDNIKFLECRLETGRTHQIRVHLCSEQMPIVGDKNYGTVNKKLLQNCSLDVQQKILNFPRQALHAGELGFWHPKKKKQILCKSSLPQDMQELLDILN
jgi:23S rRNA pseudouridine1911/1915/1917 synthase